MSPMVPLDTRIQKARADLDKGGWKNLLAAIRLLTNITEDVDPSADKEIKLLLAACRREVSRLEEEFMSSISRK